MTTRISSAIESPSPILTRAQQRQAVRRSTPWVYSAVLHLTIFVILFDLVFSEGAPPPKEFHYEAGIVTLADGDAGDEGASEITREEEPEAEVETRESENEPEDESLPQQQATTPMAPLPDETRREPSPPTEEELANLFGVGGRPTPMEGKPDARSDPDANSMLQALVADRPMRGVPSAYASRNAAGRQAGIAASGGTKGSESAVEAGLEWLAAHQSTDGSWRLNEFDDRCPQGADCKGPGYKSYNVGGTALATMAFLGAGYHHLGEGSEPGDAGRHRRTVELALAFLRSCQLESGSFGERGVNMYNHALATLALAEAYGLSRDARLRRPLERAVAFLASAQEPRGGWNYATQARIERNDVSITGWVVMALHAARTVGINVSESSLVRARRFVAGMTAIDGHVGYADSGQNAFRDSLALLPVGLFVELLGGGSGKDAKSIAQVRELRAHQPRWSETPSLDRSLYYVYYGTLALYFVGGEAWNEWNKSLLTALVTTQRKDGHARGSWDPIAKWAEKHGGRVYSTALCVLTLEIYYKYRPSYLDRAGRSLLPAGDLGSEARARNQDESR